MTTEASHRFLDHTGDFGLEVTAPTWEAAVSEVVVGFVHLVTGRLDSVEATEEREIDVEGIDAADALVALGNELLFLFETEGFLCARFEADELDELDDDGVISGVAWGEAFDPDRHPIARPVKAVTHHGVSIERAPERTTVRLIFDL